MSIQKFRENHETIKQITTQLQHMQEQMIFLNGSVEFQDIESNYSGRLSHVSSQPEMILSCRSSLSRDERLPLDTWNQSGVQGNVFGHPCSTFDSPRDFIQRNLPHQTKVKASLASGDGQNYGTIHCRCLRQDR